MFIHAEYSRYMVKSATALECVRVIKSIFIGNDAAKSERDIPPRNTLSCFFGKEFSKPRKAQFSCISSADGYRSLRGNGFWDARNLQRNVKPHILCSRTPKIPKTQNHLAVPVHFLSDTHTDARSFKKDISSLRELQRLFGSISRFDCGIGAFSSGQCSKKRAESYAPCQENIGHKPALRFSLSVAFVVITI